MNKILVGLLALGVAGAAAAQDSIHKGAPEASSDQAQPAEAQPMANPAAVQLAQADQQFGSEIASNGNLEIQLGRLAQEKGMSQSIKDLGRMMVDDHSKTNEKFLGIAQPKGFKPSSELLPEHQASLAKLSALSGKEFDVEYKQAMIDGHTKTIAKFEQHLSSTQDADIKSFVQETLPTLKHHLQMAQDAKVE